MVWKVEKQKLKASLKWHEAASCRVVICDMWEEGQLMIEFLDAMGTVIARTSASDYEACH
jgi:hypothetical protein